MAADVQVMRQWKLLRCLSARTMGVSLADLAREFDVKTRTINRDLTELRQLGFPLEAEVGSHGKKHWKLVNAGLVPGVTFPYDQALALYLGRRFLEPLAGTPVYEAAQQAFSKIRATLDKSALQFLDQLSAAISHKAFGAGDYTEQGECIDDLLHAIAERRVAFVEYRSLKSTEPVEHELCPLGLAWHKGALFLVAQSRSHYDEIRTFKVDRISSVQVQNFEFPPPDGFKLDEHLAGSFGVMNGSKRVKAQVWFSPMVARYVSEGRWHASQNLVQQSDGSLMARFELTSTEEFSKWLLSFGRHAEVLSPTSLRECLARELGAALANYSVPDGASVGPKHRTGSKTRT